ncbi:MAG: GNAT family N-acetyltransferase [Clostridium sp.]|uniref:GNAT family N-acetyltransferase n=1 Tax=Clostridium sp. TaxID=1506 RepID=UPI00306925F5
MNKIDLAFDKFPMIETNKFILRQVKDTDYKDIYEIYCEEEAVKYQQTTPMETMEQAHKSVAAFLRGFEEKRFIRWCIEEKSSFKVIGLIALNNFNKNNFNCTIGYMLNKKYWRKNVMSEVGEAIIGYGFKTLNLHRIEALIHPDNIPSISLCRKLGFEIDGISRESVYNKEVNKYEDRVIFSKLNSGVEERA